jgi:Na+-driven multidrug efflux pump
LALLLTTAVAARISDVAVAAHQIAFQIWTFLALTLDAIAIAGQALVGRFLGASDGAGAKAASRRMLEWGIVVGLVLGVLTAVLRPVLVPLFTDSTAVESLAEQQPVAGAVFVLDGILIGAGDSRYLAAAMAVATLLYIPIVGLVSALDGGLIALWAAFSLWVVARLVGMGARFATERWAVTGAVRRA